MSSRPARALLRVSQLPALYRGASPGRVTLVSLYNPAAKPPSCHDTIYCIVIHSPSNQTLACAPLALARGPAVSQPNWPYHGVPLRTPACPLGCVARPGTQRPCLSRYNTVYRDSITKWAVAHSSFYFFFSFSFFHFFSSHSSYWKTTKEIFFFIFQYNQINLLNFILFFFQVLHTVKP